MIATEADRVDPDATADRLACIAQDLVRSAADVAAGNVLLGFPVVGRSAMEVELVNIGPDPSVYRRSLSIYEDRTGTTRVLGIIATAVGGASLMTGAVLLPIGLARDSGGRPPVGSRSAPVRWRLFSASSR